MIHIAASCRYLDFACARGSSLAPHAKNDARIGPHDCWSLMWISCSIPISTASSVQKKLVLSYFHEVLDGRKADLIDSIFQPDCALHFGSSEVKGIDGVRTMLDRQKTMYSKLATEVHDIFEWGDRVVVRLTHRATGAGILRSRIGSYDVSGKSLTWDAIVIFRMKNGKIAEDWSRCRRR